MQPERNKVIDFNRRRSLQTVSAALAVTRHHLVRDDIVTAFHLHRRELHERIGNAVFRIAKPEGGFPQVGVEFVVEIVRAFAHAVTATRLHMESVPEVEAVTAGVIACIPFQILQGLEFYIFEEHSRPDEMILVNLPTHIQIVMERRFEIRYGTEFLVVIRAGLVHHGYSSGVHPSQARLPQNYSRRDLAQFVRRRRREEQLFARRIFARSAVHTAQRDVAQDSAAHPERTARIPVDVQSELGIGSAHRPDGIVTAHTLVNKIAVVDTFYKRARQAIVTHVARTGSHRLVDGRVRLFFRKAELVIDAARNTAVIVVKTRIQATHPAMFKIRRIQGPAFVLQEMAHVKEVVPIFGRLRPCHRAQRIAPFLAIGIAAAFRQLLFHAFARVPAVPYQAETRSRLAVTDFVFQGAFAGNRRLDLRIAHIEVTERAPKPLQVFRRTERLVTFLFYFLDARHTHHAHIAHHVFRLVKQRKLRTRRIPNFVFALAVPP